MLIEPFGWHGRHVLADLPLLPVLWPFHPLVLPWDGLIRILVDWPRRIKLVLYDSFHLAPRVSGKLEIRLWLLFFSLRVFFVLLNDESTVLLLRSTHSILAFELGRNVLLIRTPCNSLLLLDWIGLSFWRFGVDNSALFDNVLNGRRGRLSLRTLFHVTTLHSMVTFLHRRKLLYLVLFLDFLKGFLPLFNVRFLRGSDLLGNDHMGRRDGDRFFSFMDLVRNQWTLHCILSSAWLDS